MPKENFQTQNKLAKLFNPKTAIFLFILIVLLVPLYESKRVLIWGTQRETQNENIFLSAVLAYAALAEEAKEEIGLDSFFKKEHFFWLKLKRSPIVFQEPIPKITIVEKDEKQEDKKEEKKIVTEENSEKKEETETKTLPILKSDAPFRILIIGDSFIAVWGGVGEILEKELLNYKDVAVLRKGKVSSGLSRPDYFNWNLKTYELISQFGPNIVIIMIGLNDAQTLTTSEGRAIVAYGTEVWNQKYAERVSELLDIFEENNIIVFWIGLPVMREKIYSGRMSNLNAIYEREIQDRDTVFFIPTRDLFADENGNYISHLPDESGRMKLIRTSDGIHLQYFGGKIVAKEVIQRMEEILGLERK